MGLLGRLFKKKPTQSKQKPVAPRFQIINERDEIVYDLGQSLLDNARKKCEGE
jgi:predicted transcriptional regulator